MSGSTVETIKGLERTSSISVTDCWNATLTGGRPEKFALLMPVPLSCVKLLYVTTGYTSRTEAHKTQLAAPCESRQEFNQGTAVRLTHRHPPGIGVWWYVVESPSICSSVILGRLLSYLPRTLLVNVKR